MWKIKNKLSVFCLAQLRYLHSDSLTNTFWAIYPTVKMASKTVIRSIGVLQQSLQCSYRSVLHLLLALPYTNSKLANQKPCLLSWYPVKTIWLRHHANLAQFGFGRYLTLPCLARFGVRARSSRCRGLSLVSSIIVGLGGWVGGWVRSNMDW